MTGGIVRPSRAADRAEREVAVAGSDGTLAPAMKAWALSLSKSNQQGWRDYVTNAPVILATGSQLEGQKPEKATTLKAEEIA
jgi:hypothetical protein